MRLLPRDYKESVEGLRPKKRTPLMRHAAGKEVQDAAEGGSFTLSPTRLWGKDWGTAE
jgi:hypothetical protein